MECI